MPVPEIHRIIPITNVWIRPEVGLPGRYVSKKTGRLVPQAMYIVNKVDYMQLPQAMNHHAADLHGYAIAAGYEYSQQS